MAAALQRKVREIIDKIGPEVWDTTPKSLVARELAATLEQLETATDLHRRLHSSLLRAECRLGTALMQPQKPADRLRIASDLVNLETRRRELALIHHGRESELMHRLLKLLNQYVHLDSEDDG